MSSNLQANKLACHSLRDKGLYYSRHSIFILSAQVPITKIPQTGGLTDNRNLFLTVSEVRKLKIQAILGPGEDFLPVS